MPKYPKRGSHFAHRFTRLLTKAAVAQELGPECCWLLTIVSHQEDAKRYSGPVIFWNQQLMALCGFGSERRLSRTRDACVEAGFLHYEPGGNRKPGRYWCLTPDYLESDDSPVDEGIDLQFDAHGDAQNASHGAGNVTGIAQPRRKHSACPSTLSLNPNPNKTPCSPPQAGDVTEGQDADASSEDQPPAPERDVIADGFRQFWSAYPKRSGEDAARKAFTKAVGRAQQERGKGRAEAIQHLTDKSSEFAASPRGQGEFCPDASRWLADGRWKDDPATWQVPQPVTVIGSASDTGAREAWRQFTTAAKLWNPADATRCRKARDSLPPEVMEIVDSLGGFRQFCNADHKGANQFMSEFMIAWNERSTAGVAP